MIKETTRTDKLIGVIFALAISFTCFAFAVIQESALKSFYVLCFAVWGIIILPVIFLWPRSERVFGGSPNGRLKLDIPKRERRNVFRRSLPLTLMVLCAYLFVWAYMRGWDAGLGLIIVSVIALACCLVRLLMSDTKDSSDEEVGANERGRVPEGAKLKSRCLNAPELIWLKKWKWLACLVLICILIRIIAMCTLYGFPSFCPDCIMYWGKHKINGSGMHLPEHSLFML